MADFSMGAATVSREMAEEFISGNDAGQLAYRALRDGGMEHGEARNEIARVLLSVAWAVSKGLTSPDTANENVLYPALERIAVGESAQEIFTDDWRGETLRRPRVPPSRPILD